ncbi:cytochrome c-type biogenesis protein CycH [Bacterioplanes sanyensis]|uniref:c-type cytochrome biogenesis protein CcmI n=1 Tax=Bacterioplanes sanyensis TaxID=1249553 RepID=UPI0016770B7D|nr:c-type cytochrome biogenesis protein CcmI [Bacterioplanes sanyensis]GGY33335.1 cytochrome c-type biogenesis protein CycH [Bacterioplanes sanyensis]
MMLALLLLAIPLAMFLLKPVWFRPSTEQVSQSEENLRLYQERTQELADSDLPEDEKNTLQLELDREFLASADGAGLAFKTGSKRERIPLAIALIVLTLASTVWLYQKWGASNELRATELLMMSGQSQLSELERQELMQRLARATEREPDNVEWAYLRGRILSAEQKYAEAADAFAGMLEQLPAEAQADRAEALTMLAQARFFAAEQKADPEVYALLQEALTLVPDHRQALGMAGILAFELEQYGDAIEHWRGLWKRLPAGPEASQLEQGIRRAAEHLREQGGEVSLVWLERAELKVLVSLAPEAKAQAQPDDTVFVLARAFNGPPMPLAVQKLTVADLPQVITLSDDQAMAPGMNLSQFKQVTVVARISRSGQPVAQPGDWQGLLEPVANRVDDVLQLTINQPVAAEG